MKRRAVLLGPPGSGKGTIAGQLQAAFGLKHVSSGHRLRRKVETATAIGRQVQVFLDKGELAPDEFVLWRFTPGKRRRLSSTIASKVN